MGRVEGPIWFHTEIDLSQFFNPRVQKSDCLFTSSRFIDLAVDVVPLHGVN